MPASFLCTQGNAKRGPKKQRPPFQAAPEFLLPQLVDERLFYRTKYNQLSRKYVLKNSKDRNWWSGVSNHVLENAIAGKGEIVHLKILLIKDIN